MRFRKLWVSWRRISGKSLGAGDPRPDPGSRARWALGIGHGRAPRLRTLRAVRAPIAPRRYFHLSAAHMSSGNDSSGLMGALAIGIGGAAALACALTVRAGPRADRSRRELSVVVTGSTRGLGLAMAEEFLKLGDKVVVSSSSAEHVESAVSRLRDRVPSCRVRGCVADVRSAEDAQRLAQTAVKEFGRLDIWVNNAGVTQFPKAPLHETRGDDVAKVISTNLLGTLHGASAAIATMLLQPGRKKGRIFLMEGAGSRGGGTAGSAAYGASKAALPQLAKSLQKELKGSGVGCTLLSPGMVMTDLLLRGNAHKKATLQIFNVLAENPETTAAWLVPRIRGSETDTPIRYLTASGVAYRVLAAPWRMDRLVKVDYSK